MSTMSDDMKSKKRKREESAAGDADGRPSAKQARSESPFMDGEDLPLAVSDAQKILTVLEAVDTDGLLDRLFYFPTPTSSRVSLKSLLKNPSAYSLRQLRGALGHLLPSSSQPRALLAAGAANQQRFCEFSQELFDEVATRGLRAINPQRETVLQSEDEDDAEKVLPLEDRKRKYALVQRLPTGDWWSSATIPREGDVGLTKASVKTLAIKQAELVSIIPSQPIPPDEMPIFATLKPTPLIKGKDDPKKSITLPTKTLPAPKLLDYGVYSTFAPYFDSENSEIGNDEIHQLVHESLTRRKARALRHQLIEKQRKLAEAENALHRPAVDTTNVKLDIDEKAVAALEEDTEMEADDQDKDAKTKNKLVDGNTAVIDPAPLFPSDEMLQNLQNIIPQDETEILKQAFVALRAEFGVSELLEENGIALDALISMQRDRLRQSNLTPSDLEQQIAEALESSFALLVSSRPRTSSRPDESIIPAVPILRALHRSLPQPVSGWRGTLASNRTTSLRDDATMYVKATARAQAAAAANANTGPQAPAPRVHVPGTPTPATPTMHVPHTPHTPHAPHAPHTPHNPHNPHAAHPVPPSHTPQHPQNPYSALAGHPAHPAHSAHSQPPPMYNHITFQNMQGNPNQMNAINPMYPYHPNAYNYPTPSPGGVPGSAASAGAGPGGPGGMAGIGQMGQMGQMSQMGQMNQMGQMSQMGPMGPMPPGGPGAAGMGSGARVVPNLMQPKGGVPATPGAWTGYPGPGAMAPPYAGNVVNMGNMGKPGAPPVRSTSNTPFYKQ